MQTPLERAARALMLHHDCDPDVFIGMHGGYGHFLEAARAVLEAIREPSEAMKVAGESGLCRAGVDNVQSEDSVYCWQAMLDTALKDE